MFNYKSEEKAEKERIAKEIAESNGICNIRYNNYNDEFEIANGKIDASLIDKAYLFKKVFVGNYKIVVKLDNIEQGEEIDE